MSVFLLKVIAMGTMLCDHIGLKFFDDNAVMRNIGRFAFFIYAFLMAEGYIHMAKKPDRIKAHLVKLFALAAVSEIAYDLFDHDVWDYPGTQSVIPTLALGFAALILAGLWRERSGNRFAAFAGELAVYGSAAYLSYAFRTEYKFAGVLLVVFFYYYLTYFGDSELPVRALALSGVFIAYFLVYFWSRSGFDGLSGLGRSAVRYLPWYVGSVLSIVPLALYNRRLGYHSRWFGVVYSWFYPVQFLLLYLAAKIL